jgi:hypothetical protein
MFFPSIDFKHRDSSVIPITWCTQYLKDMVHLEEKYKNIEGSMYGYGSQKDRHKRERKHL